MRSRHCAFAVVMLLWVPAASATATPPSIYNLGTLGRPSSNAFAINSAGQVTGVAGDAPWHAFLYTGMPGSGGVMHDLGTLGGTYSIGADMNDSGQIGGDSHAVTPHSRTSAFLYTGAPGSGGMMHDLGTLGGISSWAYGINDSGQIVGKSATLPNFHEHAFLYSGTPGVDGMMHDLGFSGYGADINNSGQIVGTNNAGGFPGRAFLYTGTPGVDGVMHDLGSVNPYDGGSRASAINDLGRITGAYDVFVDDSRTVPRAFLYTGTPGIDGKMHDLGIYGSGDDINNRGQVVGVECALNGDICETRHAFVYTGTPGVDGQMIDLDAWLDANNPVEGAKWTLSRGLGINDNGLITGDGHYDDGPGGLSDGYRAFLLDASSLLLLDLPGDFNFDGSVDAADYVVWRKTDGTPDGYNTWRAKFGATLGPGSGSAGNPLGASAEPPSAAVPEPSSTGLLVLTVPAFLRRRECQRT
jgi:probable HAF family extracellular repeat protein